MSQCNGLSPRTCNHSAFFPWLVSQSLGSGLTNALVLFSLYRLAPDLLISQKKIIKIHKIKNIYNLPDLPAAPVCSASIRLMESAFFKRTCLSSGVILSSCNVKYGKIGLVITIINLNVQFTDSGIYLSGMTILSGAPNRLSIVTSLYLVPVTTSFLSRADLITSGVFTWLRACSISKSSLDLAAS